MKKIAILTLGALLAVACGNKKDVPGHDELIDSISAMEQNLATYSVTADTAKAHAILAMYNQFVENYPDDSLAPIYMLNAAEININLSDYEQGISLLDSIITLYPGFEDVAMCQFLKGQAYEQNQQYDLAREAYTEFVTKYPDHLLAADTRKMIPLVGLTPEEQLEAILGMKN
ncbi:MAG: tetratricopeptide repeat protein [bacterium]